MFSKKDLPIILMIFASLVIIGECDRTKEKIYFNVNGISACFRRLNATHQIGCNSARGGNVGVVHFVESENDIDWIITNGTHAPYAVLMSPVMFTLPNIKRLQKSGKMNGIMVWYYENDTDDAPQNFSPDQSCPNQQHSLYRDDEQYRDCRNMTWNPFANALLFEDLNIPVIAITNRTETNFIIHECYEKTNKPFASGAPRDWPLCAVLLKDAMDAAKDTPTCIRRSNLITNLNPDEFCDPLGADNVYGLTRALNSSQPLEEQSVIIAAARLDGVDLFEKGTMQMSKLDGFAAFDGIYPNVDGAVSGFVTLLAAAEVIGRVKGQLTDEHKPILFSLYQGEAFDYIGSSRVVYDMEKNQYPTDHIQGSYGPHPVGLNHLYRFLEVSQVGIPEDGTIWMHTDPISRRNNNIQDQVRALLARLETDGATVGITVADTPEVQPLPPASLQSFLKKVNISGVVLADHKNSYSNKYYNSRFDVAARIGADYPADIPENKTYDYVTDAAKHLTKVATLVARTLYFLATDEDLATDVTANDTKVTNLLYCFTKNPKCDLLQTVLGPENSVRLASKPYSTYVGVDPTSNWISALTRSVLAYYLQEPLDTEFCSSTSCSKDNCTRLETQDPLHVYSWISGPLVFNTTTNTSERLGMCIKSTVNITTAKSPAFDIKDYDWNSNEYSSWTESRWATDAIKVRVFLKPSKDREYATFFGGFGFLIISFGSIYLMNKRASLLFTAETQE